MKRLLPVLLLSSLAPVGAAMAEAPPEAPAAAEFVVGVEDQLRIVVWDEAELSMTVKVRPDGKVTLPLINDVRVTGLTPIEIRDRVAKELSEYVRDPNVTVIVEQINSFRVYFLGEVNGQGAYQFYRPTRVLQAVAVAGGPTEFAKKEITLLREDGGVEKRIRVDYKRLLAGDPAQDNFFLRPGDTLLFR